MIADKIVNNEIENIPKLYGTIDFGNMLGWNRAKVSIYLKRGTIPAPASYVGSGCRPVWTKNQILNFAETKGYKVIELG